MRSVLILRKDSLYFQQKQYFSSQKMLRNYVQNSNQEKSLAL